jgi:hypothetical protein
MSDGVEVDGSDELAASAFNYELHRLAALNSQAAQLHATFDERYEAALEARDLMEIYLADLGLKVSVAPRPFRLSVRDLGSTARRVIFCKGAHNGRPFGRHKTTIDTAYRSVRRRRP